MSDFLDKAKDMAEGLKDKVGDIAEVVGDKVSDVLPDSVEEKFGAVKDKINGLIDGPSDGAGE